MITNDKNQTIVIPCYQKNGKVFAIVENNTIEASTMLERYKKLLSILIPIYGEHIKIELKNIKIT